MTATMWLMAVAVLTGELAVWLLIWAILVTVTVVDMGQTAYKWYRNRWK